MLGNSWYSSLMSLSKAEQNIHQSQTDLSESQPALQDAINHMQSAQEALTEAPPEGSAAAAPVDHLNAAYETLTGIQAQLPQYTTETDSFLQAMQQEPDAAQAAVSTAAAGTSPASAEAASRQRFAPITSGRNAELHNDLLAATAAVPAYTHYGDSRELNTFFKDFAREHRGTSEVAAEVDQVGTYTDVFGQEQPLEACLVELGDAGNGRTLYLKGGVHGNELAYRRTNMYLCEQVGQNPDLFRRLGLFQTGLSGCGPAGHGHEQLAYFRQSKLKRLHDGRFSRRIPD
jgi:hypothetical protein